jgi:hypothetical protein
MLFRAVFWIGLVSLLVPHEPDLGFGRPHLGASEPTSAPVDRSQLEVCKAGETACSSGFWLLNSFQSVAVRSLAQVKADIEESRRAQNARRVSFLP